MAHGALVDRVAFGFLAGWLVLYLLVFFTPPFGTVFGVWFALTLIGIPLVLCCFAYGMVDGALFDRGRLPYWQIVVVSVLALVLLAVTVGLFVAAADALTPSWIAANVFVFLAAGVTLLFSPVAWRARRRAQRRRMRAHYMQDRPGV